MTITFTLFILMLSAPLLAGNDLQKLFFAAFPTQEVETHQLIPVQNFRSTLDEISYKRLLIWKCTYLPISTRNKKILNLYQEKLSELSAEEFVDLFENTSYLGNFNERFLTSHLKDFYGKNPSLKEVIKLASLSNSIQTTFLIKEYGIKLIQEPQDFIDLISIKNFNTNIGYKQSTTDFITKNLPIFIKTTPKLEDILKVQKYLFKIKSSEHGTVQAVIALKKAFINDFHGDFLIKLLDYGSNEPTDLYKTKLDELIFLHGQDFEKSIELIHLPKLKALCLTVPTLMQINNIGLKFILKAVDFLNLLRSDYGHSCEEYKHAMNDFILDNIAIFRNTNPQIKDVIALQDMIFSFQINVHKTIPILIRLKDFFIKSFVNADLIWLLAPGCDQPHDEYLKQIDALKRNYQIQF